jgi:hypothetical protein
MVKKVARSYGSDWDISYDVDGRRLRWTGAQPKFGMDACNSIAYQEGNIMLERKPTFTTVVHAFSVVNVGSGA